MIPVMSKSIVEAVDLSLDCCLDEQVHLSELLVIIARNAADKNRNNGNAKGIHWKKNKMGSNIFF